MCDFVFGFCLRVGLSVCWVSKLCLSVCPSKEVMLGMGFVCLSVSRSYAWHGVCLFVRLKKLCLAWGLSVCPSQEVMLGMGFVCLSVSRSYAWHGVCLFVRLNKLCLAWGLSVCPSQQVMFGMGFVCLST